ncbi:uncharacterized protein LOC144009823 [Festucalex cinctus]
MTSSPKQQTLVQTPSGQKYQSFFLTADSILSSSSTCCSPRVFVRSSKHFDKYLDERKRRFPQVSFRPPCCRCISQCCPALVTGETCTLSQYSRKEGKKCLMGLSS